MYIRNLLLSKTSSLKFPYLLVDLFSTYRSDKTTLRSLKLINK